MKKLGQSALGTGTGTLVYTVPTAQKTEVLDINIANTSAVTVNVRLHLVPSGGSVATSNAMFYDVPVYGNTTVQWTGVSLMDTGDFIRGIGSASGVTVTISGNEYRANV
jgi:hypothetical protein